MPGAGDVVSWSLRAKGISDDWQEGEGIPGWIKRNTKPAEPIQPGSITRGTISAPVRDHYGDIKAYAEFNKAQKKETVESRIDPKALEQRRIEAAMYADGLNASQANGPVTSYGITGLTTYGDNRGGSSGGGSSFSRTVHNVANYVSNAANSFSQTVRSYASQAAQSISNAVTSVAQSIGNFFSNLFGGGKKK